MVKKASAPAVELPEPNWYAIRKMGKEDAFIKAREKGDSDAMRELIVASGVEVKDAE